jgi:hypothetical protein
LHKAFGACGPEMSDRALWIATPINDNHAGTVRVETADSRWYVLAAMRDQRIVPAVFFRQDT